MKQNYLKNELNEEVGQCKRYALRMQLIRHKGLALKPDFAALKHKYNELQKILSQRFPQCTIKTHAERRIFETISHSTNLKFYQSFWIANRNVDLFCPAIGQLYPPIIKGRKISRQPCMRGLVIEVDGPIHYQELKMKKDFSKSSYLQKLGIGHTVIENSDIESGKIKKHIDHMKKMPRLDHRARQRLLRKVYTATLAFHATDDVICDLYGSQILTSKEQLLCNTN